MWVTTIVRCTPPWNSADSGSRSRRAETSTSTGADGWPRAARTSAKSGLGPQRPVALDACGPRADEHCVGETAQDAEHRFVARSAERAGATVDGGCPVERTDHVGAHPRKPGRVGGIGVGRLQIDLVDGCGQQLAHQWMYGGRRGGRPILRRPSACDAISTPNAATATWQHRPAATGVDVGRPRDREPADRAEDADQQGQQAADRLASWHDETTKRADDEPDEDRSQDGVWIHAFSLPRG